MYFPKSSALVLFIDLSAIVAMLFTTIRHNAILSKDTNNFKLLIKGSLLIAYDNPVLNKTLKSLPLELFKQKNTNYHNKVFDSSFNKKTM